MTKKDLIYLDYNATAPIRPQVIDIMTEVMKEGGNPSSVHSLGRKAKSRLEEARSIIAEVIGCRPQMIAFTSGGTESNNMAVMSSGRKKLITTNAEHESIRSTANRFDGEVRILEVDRNGLINLDQLAEFLKMDGNNTLVSILYANNETGIIQDIENISEITSKAGALLHIDAIQAFGKIPMSFMDMGIDMMSISSHKIGGPQGVGALIALEKLGVKSPILGGGQEVGRRGGTENIAGIAGFGMAASLIDPEFIKMKEIESWRNEMEQRISEQAEGALFLGNKERRLPNVSTIYMPDVTSETQVMNFDLDKICISSGSACSSGKVKSSHVVQAMTESEEIASSTIRVSMGWNSNYDDMDRFVKSWIKQYDRKHG